MATASVIYQRVRDNLYSAVLNERPLAHTINGAIDSSTTSIVVHDGTNFAAGDIIEFMADGEQCYITTVATNTLTVIRGWGGTTKASQADDETILKNPRFTYKQIEDAVTAVLHELVTHGIHSWGTGSITLVSGQLYYNLTATDILEYPGVVAVYYADTTTSEIKPLPFKYSKGIHATLSTTGHGLTLWEYGDRSAGDALYYTYAQVIDATADLLSRQEDLVVNGATAKVLGKAIAPRSHDPGRMTDKGVKPGQDAIDARWYQAEFYMQSRAEVAQLRVEAKHLPGTLQLKVAGRWSP